MVLVLVGVNRDVGEMEPHRRITDDIDYKTSRSICDAGTAEPVIDLETRRYHRRDPSDRAFVHG